MFDLCGPFTVRAADCQWLDVFDNYYIPGNDKKVLGGKEVEDCQKICEEETSFVCMSFDYYKPTKTCYFHEVDRFTKALSVSTAFKYYERNCQRESLLGHFFLGRIRKGFGKGISPTDQSLSQI